MIRRTLRARIGSIGVAFLLMAGSLLLEPSSSEAIPAFARKYRTSCQTCHIAYPKLNPFGEAFRLKGYRMPEEPEELKVGLLSGGTSGESVSFFGEIALAPEVEAAKSEVGVEIEHAQFNFNGPFGWGHGFSLKMGRFVPELLQLLSHTHSLDQRRPAVMLQFIPIAPGGGPIAD